MEGIRKSLSFSQREFFRRKNFFDKKVKEKHPEPTRKRVRKLGDKLSFPLDPNPGDLIMTNMKLG